MSPQLNLSHQSYIIKPNFIRPVTIIGAGSVGSFVAMALAKSGVTDLTVYDDDYVASHNVPMSAYGVDDVGQFKVHALAGRLLGESGMTPKTHCAKYVDQRLSGTIVACVDSMQARKIIWEGVRKNPRVDLLCDTRTHGAYYELYSVNPHSKEDAEEYQKSLYADEDTLLHSCGYHGAAFASMAAASAVVSQVVRYWQTKDKKFYHAEKRDILYSVQT